MLPSKPPITWNLSWNDIGPTYNRQNNINKLNITYHIKVFARINIWLIHVSMYGVEMPSKAKNCIAAYNDYNKIMKDKMS